MADSYIPVPSIAAGNLVRTQTKVVSAATVHVHYFVSDVDPTLTPANATWKSIGTTTTIAVAANTARRGLYMVNTSSSRMSFNLSGATAQHKKGLVLYPGQTFWMDSFCFTTGAIAGICQTSAATLALQEFT